jgi:very-short-patch-repair endonuclease
MVDDIGVMPRRPTSKILPLARALRRNMTSAEALLWRMLRNRGLDGLKFRRQVPIGRYVADFLCEDYKLIVELDGAPHDRPHQKAHDDARDIWLRSEGYLVLRIANDAVIGGGDLPLDLIRSALRGR